MHINKFAIAVLYRVKTRFEFRLRLLFLSTSHTAQVTSPVLVPAPNSGHSFSNLNLATRPQCLSPLADQTHLNPEMRAITQNDPCGCSSHTDVQVSCDVSRKKPPKYNVYQSLLTWLAELIRTKFATINIDNKSRHIPLSVHNSSCIANAFKLRNYVYGRKHL